MNKNAEDVKKLVTLFTEFKELGTEIKRSREDENVSWVERFKIALESIDVVKAIVNLKGFQVSTITDEQIGELVDFVMSEWNGELKFTRNQAIYGMSITKYLYLLIEDIVD